MTEEATLRQLQRLDADIAHIICKSRHVAIYSLKFDGSGREIWEREKMEGALFVVRRQVEPLFALCVLNRMSTTDLYQRLTFGSNDFELEFSKNFIIYRSQSSIKAIWFAEDQEEMAQVKEAIESAEREVLNTPPLPRYISRRANGVTDGSGELLSMEQMRDTLFRLLANDKFMQTLHSQYIASEQRRKSQQSTSPAQPFQQQFQQQVPHQPQIQQQHPMSAPRLAQPHPHPQLPPGSPLDQHPQQPGHFFTGQPPFLPPPYSLHPGSWRGPPPNVPYGQMPMNQPLQLPPRPPQQLGQPYPKPQ